MTDDKSEARARTKEIAAEYAKKGDATSWFEALYRESAGDTTKIPWADLEPNRYLAEWAEQTHIRGNGREALVVGCGLGDDARFLHHLGFKATAFDISPTAIAWARKLHDETDISFATADLFASPTEWHRAFDFVLEVYTIQPLPLEMRPEVIDAIAGFVAPGGRLLVVTRGRDNDEEPLELPWALSRRDLSRFAENGLKEIDFREMPGDEDVPAVRFVVEYERETKP